MRTIILLGLLCSGAGLFAADELDELVTADRSGRLAYETQLRLQYRKAEGQERQRILTALNRSDHPQALAVAIELTEDDPAATTAVLDRVRARPAAAGSLPAVRELTGHHDPAVRKAAMGTLATLDDDRSLDLLVAQLGDPATSDSARKALRQITGLQYRDPAAWYDWHDQETRRLEKALPVIGRRLTADDPKEVMTAVHQLLQMEHHTGLAMDMLEPLLLHEDPAIAALAQEGFARIGGSRAEHILSLYDEDDLAWAREGVTEATRANLQGSIGERTAPEGETASDEQGSSTVLTIIVLIVAAAGVIVYLRIRKAESGKGPPRRRG